VWITTVGPREQTETDFAVITSLSPLLLLEHFAVSLHHYQQTNLTNHPSTSISCGESHCLRKSNPQTNPNQTIKTYYSPSPLPPILHPGVRGSAGASVNWPIDFVLLGMHCEHWERKGVADEVDLVIEVGEWEGVLPNMTTAENLGTTRIGRFCRF
jgi:hypothetical protein